MRKKGIRLKGNNYNQSLLEVALVGTTELSEQPTIQKTGISKKEQKDERQENSDSIELNLQTSKQQLVFHGL
jgi:hypothetical protein